MPISPIFDRELIAIARREYLYVFRWTYGLALLLFVCAPMYFQHGLSSSLELDTRELAALNQYFLWSIVSLQAAAVLILVPALVGGALAEEKQRRGLEVLLTTTLSSTEIVLGKLLARMCYLTVVLMVTIPVFCLLSLNGGIDVGLVALSYAVTFTTGFLIAALAIAVSTLTDRPFKAVMATYFLVLAWLIFPVLPDPFDTLAGASTFAALVGRGMAYVQQWIGATNPLYAIEAMSWTILSHDLVVALAITAVAQVGISALLILGSVTLLRPLMRREGSPASRFKLLSFLLSRRSLLPRRGCGDRPILWKECYLSRMTVLTRLAIALALLGIAVPVSAETSRLSADAFRELGVNGYGTLGTNVARNELNTFLRFAVVIVYLAMAFAVAARSALSVTKEIEKQTWISLIATPLEAKEVVGGKVVGALWSIRWLGWLYLAFVILGVASGAVHPLAGCLVIVEALVFLAFLAILGISISLWLRSSVRALAMTMLAILILNGGYMLCCLCPGDIGYVILVPNTPLIQGLSLATYQELEQPPLGALGHLRLSLVGLSFMSLVAYGVTALILFRLWLSNFDVVAGRPRRDRPDTPKLPSGSKQEPVDDPDSSEPADS